MGQKSPFNKTQDAALKAILSEYEAKISQDGLQQKGLLQWKKDKCEEFLKEFQTELEATEKPELAVWRERVMRHFINFNSQWNKTQLKAASSTSSHPLLQFPEETVVQGRELFRQANATAINDEATNRRERAGEDSKKHAGHYQRVLKEKWEDLTDEKRMEWTTKAEEESKVGANDNSDIYRNQQDFSRLIVEVFRGMIGHGPNRIGDAQLHLVYGMRKSDDTLDLGCLSVGPEPLPKGSRFQDKFVGYKNFLDNYAEFCEQTIPHVSGGANHDMVVSRDATGHPVLPLFNNEDTRLGDMRVLLKTFLNEAWDYAWPKDEDMPGIPWDSIVSHPEDYISPSNMPQGLSLCSPEIMSAQDLFIIATQIHHLQNTSSTFFFRTKSDISQRIQARLEEERPEPEEPVNEATHPPSPSLLPSSATVTDVNAKTTETMAEAPKSKKKGSAKSKTNKRKLKPAPDNIVAIAAAGEPALKRRKMAVATKPPIELVIRTRRQNGLISNNKTVKA